MTAYAFFFNAETFQQNRLAVEAGVPVPIDYVASNSSHSIKRFAKGDELFVVGLQSHQVLLAGRLIVSGDAEERSVVVEKTNRDDYVDRAFVCLGDPAYLEHFRPDFEVPSHISRGLELLDKDGTPYKDTTIATLRSGMPDNNIFRACPRLSEASANQLRLLLGSRPTASVQESIPTGFDDDAYREQLIKTRRGQSTFRQNLLRTYGGRCQITRCGVEALLEAAHITPHAEFTDYRISNGLLLRADIHTLFDLHLITVDEHYRVRVSDQLRNSEYWIYNGRQLDPLPDKMEDQPNSEALRERTSKLKSA